MEIEAKFSFSDAAAFATWQQRDTIGPFALGPGRSRDVVDRYIDTDRCDCLAGGYACRIRRQGSAFEVTLKSLLDAEAGGGSGVRRRDEIEVTLATPTGEAETETGGGLLPRWQQPEAWPESDTRALALRLTRGRPLRRLVTVRQQRHERDVVDGERVVAVQSLDRVSFDAGGTPMLELEVELTPQGTDDDIAAVVHALSAEQGFQADRRSKLGQALDSISPRTERSILAQDTLFIAHLAEERDRHCARAALQLFDASRHGDADGVDRLLLQQVVRVLVEGRTVRPGDPAGAARDLLAGRPDAAIMQGSSILAAALEVLASSGAGESDTGQAGNAFAGPGYTGLDRPGRTASRRLAAVLDAALALDASGGQTTRIAAVTSTERRTNLALSGPEAAEDGAAAEGTSDLWEAAFDVRLRCRAIAADEQAPLGLRFDQNLAGAGRVILRAQLERLETCEAGVRAGDEEALHDGRVAVRRMRTALQLLRHAYISRETAPLLDGLKRAGDRLGAVRDLDVLLGRVRHDREQLPEPSALDPLLAAWEQRRDVARRRLLQHLDSRTFRDWHGRFAAFLEGGGCGRRGADRVCDVLPGLIWKRHGVVRSHQQHVDNATPEELHELRKEAKQLRYLLEFFRELLGKETAVLVKQVTAVQDELGALHDAIVLRDLLDLPLDLSTMKGAAGTSSSAGLEPYRLRVLAAIPQHRRDFEALWPALAGRGFRKTLALAVAAV